MSNLPVIVLTDKWGTTIYDATNRDETALYILTNRVNDGYWYDSEAEKRAESILADENGLLAWRFLSQRSYDGYEYEDIDLTEVKSVPPR